MIKPNRYVAVKLKRYYTIAGIVAFLGLHHHDAQAAVELFVGYAAEATDNVRLQADDTRYDVIHGPFVELSTENAWTRAEFNGDYRFEARRYGRSTFGNDDALTGRSELLIDVRPDRLRWAVDHVRAETLIDRRVGDLPENRRRSDVIGTELLATLMPGSADDLDASARVERFRSNRGFDDNDRYRGRVAYRRHQSPVQSVGLEAELEGVSFDDERAANFRRVDLRGVYNRELRTAGLETGIGYNKAYRSGLPNRDGIAFNVSAFWVPATTHRIELSASRELTDRADAAFVGIPDFGDPRDRASEDGAVFEQTLAGLTYHYELERWTFTVGADWTKEDFDDATLDTRRYGGRIAVQFQASPRVIVDTSARVVDTDFTGTERDDREFDLVGQLTWTASPRLSLRIGAGLARRDSDLPSDEYREKRGFLGFTYQIM